MYDLSKNLQSTEDNTVKEQNTLIIIHAEKKKNQMLQQLYYKNHVGWRNLTRKNAIFLFQNVKYFPDMIYFLGSPPVFQHDHFHPVPWEDIVTHQVQEEHEDLHKEVPQVYRESKLLHFHILSVVDLLHLPQHAQQHAHTLNLQQQHTGTCILNLWDKCFRNKKQLSWTLNIIFIPSLRLTLTLSLITFLKIGWWHHP